MLMGNYITGSSLLSGTCLALKVFDICSRPFTFWVEPLLALVTLDVCLERILWLRATTEFLPVVILRLKQLLLWIILCTREEGVVRDRC